jgi:hypothetical protein
MRGAGGKVSNIGSKRDMKRYTLSDLQLEFPTFELAH